MAFERGKTQRLLTKHSVFWEHIDAASPGSRFEATDRRVRVAMRLVPSLKHGGQDSPDGAVLGWQFRRQEASKPARTCGDGRDEPPEEGSILREIFCLASVLQDEHRSLVVPAYVVQRYGLPRSQVTDAYPERQRKGYGHVTPDAPSP